LGKWNEESKKLIIPYYDDNSSKGHYDINTHEERLVSEHTGFNFREINELCVFEYWLYLRDAVIYRYSETESGREYLDKCWTLEQTEPDRQALRKKLGSN
jgi:hypothetical protein